MPRTHLTAAVCLTLLSACVQSGCQTTREAYYNAWEGMGYAKRERLADNVKAARQEQDEAKQEFANALEQFRSVVNFDGGSVEPVYNKLKGSYDDCKSQADAVNDKIKSVKNVGTALFDEWQGEISQIKDDPDLERQSQELFEQTRESYDELLERMDAAAASMQPVLSKFNNRVIFIKSALNAQAIASLKGTEAALGGDIEKLIQQMEASIAEADRFIAEISQK
jgi:hypothetical protein